MEGKGPYDTLRMRRTIWMRMLRMFEGISSLGADQLYLRIPVIIDFKRTFW